MPDSTYVQYTSESRTIRHSNGHLSDTFWVRVSNGKKQDGGHFVKTIRKPDFLFGFRMVAPFESGTEVFLTSSLDRFGMNKIFFYDRLLIKRSRLSPTIWKPDLCPAFKWSGYRMVGTGIRSNHKAVPCPAFGCILYSYFWCCRSHLVLIASRGISWSTC
jgi:hypothetical protein